MKKLFFVVFLQLLVTFFFINPVNAEIVTVYQSVDPIEIFAKSGTATTMIFPAEIETAIVGSQSSFSVQEDVNQDKLIISALKSGVWTNLTVIDKNDNVYVFRLIENKENNYYDLVRVMPKESLPYSTIVKIINNERYNVDPDIKKLVEMYEVEEFAVDIDGLKTEIIKSAEIINTDETVYWIRLHNTSDKKYMINTFGLKEREIKSIITSDEMLESGSYGDYFVITRGRGLDKTLTLNIIVNGEIKNVLLENIPFIHQNFKVYEINRM